jgi:hypothetical protein
MKFADTRKRASLAKAETHFTGCFHWTISLNHVGRRACLAGVGRVFVGVVLKRPCLSELLALTLPRVDADLISAVISCFAVLTKHQTGHTINPLSFFFTVVNIMGGVGGVSTFFPIPLIHCSTTLLFFSGIGQPNFLIVDAL